MKYSHITGRGRLSTPFRNRCLATEPKLCVQTCKPGRDPGGEVSFNTFVSADSPRPRLTGLFLSPRRG